MLILESLPRTHSGARRIIFDAQHTGFDGIVNGGYVAGVLQSEVGRAAEVRLMRPVPPDRALAIVRPDRVAVALMHEGEVLASAIPKALDFVAPEAISFECALDAQHAYLGLRKTPAPNCFVCGPRRQPGLGLHIFAGDLTPGNVAAAWVPDAAVVGGAAEVDARFIGAALDCPGGWAIASLGEAEHVTMLLGTLQLAIVAPVHAGRWYVVVGAADGGEGRKRFARTALYDGNGQLCALAKSIWLRVH
ncbi:MAG TPA: hypothetical protein VFR86_19020 [Burkholderiaceae bacterium]|nr:hypothetical protein [Burkholderiaceae bacterium]